LHKLGLPVPRPYVLCEDDGVIGTAFYVMDFAAGRVFWEPHMPGLSAQDRAGIFSAMNGFMADLHSAGYETAGLADFGKPEGYVARQIARWSKQYKASETSKIANMDRLMDWLPDAAPSSGQASLVHGDFRLDNCIIHADRPAIRAVLDWELSTLGDPIADFTYHLMQWRMPPSETGAGVGSLVEHMDLDGIPALEDYVALYCDRRGLAGIPDLDTYLAYNFFRMAAIFQGIVGRVRDGTAANARAGRDGRPGRPHGRRCMGLCEEGRSLTELTTPSIGLGIGWRCCTRHCAHPGLARAWTTLASSPRASPAPASAR
jgi:aminoglycoside phosphotransferase (APT) family kinase protein